MLHNLNYHTLHTWFCLASANITSCKICFNYFVWLDWTSLTWFSHILPSLELLCLRHASLEWPKCNLIWFFLSYFTYSVILISSASSSLSMDWKSSIQFTIVLSAPSSPTLSFLRAWDRHMYLFCYCGGVSEFEISHLKIPSPIIRLIFFSITCLSTSTSCTIAS